MANRSALRFQVSKLCFTLLVAFVKLSAQHLVSMPEFEAFLLQQVQLGSTFCSDADSELIQITTATFQTPLSPSFSLADHACITCLDEICELQVTLQKVCLLLLSKSNFSLASRSSVNRMSCTSATFSSTRSSCPSRLQNSIAACWSLVIQKCSASSSGFDSND